jgi:Xaa-Pro aminopeptidase
VINMEPVLKRGYTFWDQALLPSDEYTERVRNVQARMRQDGISALVIFSNSYENADTAYLAGGAGGTLFVGPDGDPVIFTGGGGRELPFQRMQTWISELTSAGGLAGARIAASLKERDVGPGATVGLVGAHLLSAGAHADLTKNLDGYNLRDVDEMMRSVRASKRPREVAAVRIALRIAQDAREAAEKAFSDGAPTTKAMVQAEGSARRDRARDFRVLANIDSNDMRPFEGLSDSGRTPLLMWLGLTYAGYWADVAFTFPEDSRGEARAAVDAMIAAAKTGARSGDVAQAGLAHLSPAAREPALSYGLGGGIGLALNDWPAITPDGNDRLIEGALLSLRAFARDGERVSFTNAIVQVGPGGGTRLTPA